MISHEVQQITSKIVVLPGRAPALLDADVAELYGTSTANLNRQAKRNPGRFPADFRFQPAPHERDAHPNLKCQFGTSSASAQGDMRCPSGSASKRNRRYRPWLYTREGCNMLSAVLNTPVAIQRSVQIMRAFSALERAAQNGGPAAVLFQLERINQQISMLRGDVNTALSAVRTVAAVAVAPAKKPPRRRHSLVEVMNLQRECKALLEGGATYERTARVLAHLAGADVFSVSSIGRYARRLHLGPKPNEPQSPEAQWVATMIAKGAADSEIAKHLRFLVDEPQR